MRKFKFLALVVAASIFVVSCQKGDAGPAGPAGANGATGPAGPAGAKGDTGTANVIYSDWLDVGFTPVTNPSNVKDTVYWGAAITAKSLTQDIMDKGEVKVFVNEYEPTSDSYSIYTLPLVFPRSTITVTPIILVGEIDVYASIDFSTLVYTSNNKKTYQYRYVLIPGGVKANSKVDWNNYSAVKNFLGLQN